MFDERTTPASPRSLHRELAALRCEVRVVRAGVKLIALALVVVLWRLFTMG